MSRPSNRYPDHDAAQQMDRALLRNVQRDIYGASAHHGLDPAEICMRVDEWDAVEHALRDRASLRNEIFSGFIEHLFSDGPAPDCVLARIEGLLRSFAPDLAEKLKGPREWITPEKVAGVLRKKSYRAKLAALQQAARSRATLYAWSKELKAERDFDCVRETIAGLIAYLLSDGPTWRNAAAVAYGVAKALRPHLIADMSLHDIAILSGDGSNTPKSARATSGERIKRIFSRRIAATGAKASHAHFQKSPTVIEKYKSAQMGNHNRKRGVKKPKSQVRKKKS